MASSDPPVEPSTKSLQFKLILLATCVSLFLAALDFTGVGTILPSLVQDLPGAGFVWVGAAYAICSAAFIPMAGILNNIYGRQPVLLVGVSLFALGSALCGGAQTLSMMLGGRAVQGAGAGFIFAGSQIVLSDLVPLAERGKYTAVLSLTWSFASVLGPVIGGLLASANAWRWLFYLNLPMDGIAAVLIICFLKMKIPPGTFMEKARKIDVVGNLLIIGSTTSFILALTWGGVEYSWSSYHVIVPLVFGILGLIGSVVYEAYIPKYPTMPAHLFKNITTVLGFFDSFLSFLCIINVVYYLPAFLQGVWMTSATRSGVLLLPTATQVATGAIICGVVIEKTGKYLIQTYCGWAITVLGLGLLSLLRPDSPLGYLIGFTLFIGFGLGILFVSNTFLVLAPLHPVDNAHAMALMAYFRALGQAVGVSVGITVLQNSLKARLSAEVLASFPHGVEMSYSIIPLVRQLPEPLKTQVREAFALSMANVWYTMAALAGVGFVASFFGKAYVLNNFMDEQYGLDDGRGGTSTSSETVGGDGVEVRGAKPDLEAGQAISVPAPEMTHVKPDLETGLQLPSFPPDT
ncbi:MFS general substrate transporter [Clavulina sp. PMI_390]|nr:MFS general substrate transporter [Clavulina sp. PMI_390]